MTHAKRRAPHSSEPEPKLRLPKRLGLHGSGLGSVGFGTARQGFESKLPPVFALGWRKRPPPTVRRYTGGGCVPRCRSAETELNPTRVLSSNEESTETAFGPPVPKTRLQSTVPTLGDPALTREVLLAPEQSPGGGPRRRACPSDPWSGNISHPLVSLKTWESVP